MPGAARALPRTPSCWSMNIDALPRAFGDPVASGRLAVTAEDFQVDEVLGFAPDGDGQHVLIQLRKQGSNTDGIARQLAKLAGVRVADVGYAGLKDRHAVTSQWFSVDLAGRPEPDWTQLETADLQVLHVARHRRKLRRGTLTGNRFALRLRDIRGDRAALQERIDAIRRRGVPNYFGPQRFGRDNLQKAAAMFAGTLTVRDRHLRGLYLSAARALLFNEVLARRVANDTWDNALPGDAMQLDGSGSFFVIDVLDDALRERLARFDVHPTGPLWGRGSAPCAYSARQCEEEALRDHLPWRDGLERAGCDHARRPLRVAVNEMIWERSDLHLKLRFFLPAGAYATMVAREIVSTTAETARKDAMRLSGGCWE